MDLPEKQELQLDDLAAKMPSYGEWFKAQVQIGIDEIARGAFIEEEEMDARVERMLQS